MVGRWGCECLQSDPARYAAGANLYAYVHGDPINGTDPTGMFDFEDMGFLQDDGAGFVDYASPLDGSTRDPNDGHYIPNDGCGGPLGGTDIALAGDNCGGGNSPGFGGGSFTNGGGGWSSGDGGGGGGVTPISSPAPAGCNTTNTDGSTQDRANFFSHLSELGNVARALNIPQNFIVGLASYESGWLDPHNQALHNLWGLTQAGGNNLNFSSYDAGNSYFVSHIGPYIQNAQTVDQFENGLRAAGYNAVNPTYYQSLTQRINSIPKWEARCGVQNS